MKVLSTLLLLATVARGEPPVKNGLIPKLMDGYRTTSPNSFSPPPSPSKNYSPPQNYAVPSRNYAVPSQNYGAPSQNFGVPTRKYGPPSNDRQTEVVFKSPNQNKMVRISLQRKSTTSRPSTKFERKSTQPIEYSGNSQSIEYSTPSQEYGPQNEQNEGPNTLYGTPNLQFGASNLQFEANQQYGSLDSQYGAVNNQYGVPFGVPNQQYGTPNQQFQVPLQLPGQLFKMPLKEYSVPVGVVGDDNPSNQYLPPGNDVGYGGKEENDAPANYNFEYSVKDEASGNDYGHRESRQDARAEGEYYVLLPDGRKQTVKYVADEQGFVPRISYEQADNRYEDANDDNYKDTSALY